MELAEQLKINKRAETSYPILDAIADRWSPRAFDVRKVPDEILMRLFEAARWAASSMNEQPWRFVYAHKGTSAHGNMVETLTEKNRLWAKNAPVLLLTLIKTDFTNSNSPNGMAKHDLGLAMGNLSIQATAEGIGLHQMGGFSPARAKALFNLPEGYEAVTAVALGYFGDADELPEPLRDRELAGRSRKALHEIAFKGSFEL